MKILITTIDRPDSVLDKCIKSIKESEIKPIIMKGGTPEEKKLEMNIQRAGYGYWKCLTNDIYDDVLIIEDDVILNDGWWFKFNELKKLIKVNRYMISLVVPMPELVGAPDVKVQTIQSMSYKATIAFDDEGNPQSTPILYSNTSAVFYSKLLLQTRLPEYIYKYCVEGKAMYDVALGHFLFRSQIPIYIMVPSLAQNVGVISSIDPKEARSHGAGYEDWGSYKI